MEKELYSIIKSISQLEFYINEKEFIKVIEKKYWGNVRDNRDSSNYIKLLYEEFYKNCIKALKKLKISKFDMQKYIALTTLINALDKVKVDNPKISKEELNELKEGAKKLINKLKIKYNEILGEKFTKNSKIAKLINEIEKGGSLKQLSPLIYNKLESSVFLYLKEVQELKERLQDSGVALMSGSGASVFALMDNKAKAEKIEATLKAEGYTVFVTRFWRASL